jgi:hypothetical protein
VRSLHRYRHRNGNHVSGNNVVQLPAEAVCRPIGLDQALRSILRAIVALQTALIVQPRVGTS